MLVTSCLLAVIGCQSTTPATPLPHSMKGWELYSWQVNHEWYFALVNGTNRLKTASEITSTEGRVISIEGIKTELSRLPQGEQVFWGARDMPEFGFPPKEIVDQVQEFCAQSGIQLTAIPYR